MPRPIALAAVAALLAAAPAYAAADNPDVSVVGDFRYDSNFTDLSLDRFRADEIELGLQGYLSPWSRADFFLSKPDGEGLEVEEAYLTLFNLPYDLKARLGKFKMPFGRLNPVHPEAWSFIDTPLVMRNLLGDEGWNNAGAELSAFVPNPLDQLVTATVDVVDGSNETAFDRGPMLAGRLSTYVPFDDDSGLDLGMSAGAQFSTPRGVDRSSLVGLDGRYRWSPGPDHSITVQGEYMQLLRPDEAPSGAYLSADYQWSRAQDLDLRLDRAYAPGQPVPETAASLTYNHNIWETTRFKVQATHTFAPVPEERLILQSIFILGPHKHVLQF